MVRQQILPPARRRRVSRSHQPEWRFWGTPSPTGGDLNPFANNDKAESSSRSPHLGDQPVPFAPYCRTCTFSSVTRPLVIISSSRGKKPLILSSLSTISITRGRSSERRNILVV